MVCPITPVYVEKNMAFCFNHWLNFKYTQVVISKIPLYQLLLVLALVANYSQPESLFENVSV